MPALNAPSPITATVRRFSPAWRAARASPSRPARGGNRGARVTDAERVVHTLGARREWSESVALLDGAQALAASREYFVGIRLMADVPHQPVVRRIENVVKCDRELDRAEAGGEVTAHLAHGVDEVLT